ncbi:MAG: LIM domain-containing protein [Spirochaetia bacterium]
MKCSTHPRAESIASCARCGRPFCGECVVEVDERMWCRECLKAILAPPTAGAHPGWVKLVAALLSLLPGAGHMFLGMIGKGFALMSLLIASVFLVILYSDATGMYWMTAYLVPSLSVLFLSYAVFDAMAICDARKGGRARPETDDETMKAVWERVLLNRRTGGWILLVAGIVGVLHIFSEPLNRMAADWLHVSVPITGLVIPVILLLIGILLLQKSRKGS